MFVLQIAIILIALLLFQTLRRPKQAVCGYVAVAFVYTMFSWIGRVERVDPASSLSSSHVPPARNTIVRVLPTRPAPELPSPSVFRGQEDALEPGFSIESVPSEPISDLALGTTLTPTSPTPATLTYLQEELPLLTPIRGKGTADLPITDLAAEGTFSFFGITELAEGPFIFVADVSPSMDGSKRKRLAEELVSSIGSYPEEAQFQVIFYAKEYSWFTGSDAYQSRNANVLTELLKTATEIKLGSSTLDKAPLCAAVARKPSAIFFHTDGQGQFHQDPSLLESLMALNEEGGKPCRIHCVEFGNMPDQHPVLKDIATRSGGEYRFIEVP